MRTTRTRTDSLLGESQSSAFAYLLLAQVAVLDLPEASHDFERQRRQAHAFLNSARRAFHETSQYHVARPIDAVNFALRYVSSCDTKKPEVLATDLRRTIERTRLSALESNG